jgi:Ca2+-binding EF-hand superfamily protein
MKSFIKTIALATGLFGIIGMAATSSAEACRGKQARLMKFDANGDGVLGRAELTNGLYARAAEKMQKGDANGDGYLDEAELLAARQARRAERRAELESNPELKAKFEKRKGKRKGKARHAAKMAKRFERIDTDGDGRLALFELQAAADRRVTKTFERLDANGDGQIAKDELPTKSHGARRGKGA